MKSGLRSGEDHRAGKVAPADTQTPTRVRSRTPGTVWGLWPTCRPTGAGKEVDARTDIFSLGAVPVRVLQVGWVRGETTATWWAHCCTRTIAPQSIAPTHLRVAHIVSKALRKEADERYQTMKSLLADLRTLKHEMEFAAKLERSAAPERDEAASTAQGPAPVTTANADVAGASTQAAAVRPTSSAEFLASGIRPHQRITIALVPLLLAALRFRHRR